MSTHINTVCSTQVSQERAVRSTSGGADTENTSDMVLYSYSDDSSYVSSTTRYTPFPSLTNMEKQKILGSFADPRMRTSLCESNKVREICNNNVTHTNEQEISEIYKIEEVDKQESVTKDSHGCCYIA